jgi:hypothetical protein
MLASLGREFPKKARKGHATALVISGNDDGSLKLTQSRVLTASGFVYTLLRIALSVAIGFMGFFSTLKGAKGGVHEVRTRGSHVGSYEQAVHAILAKAGPDAASRWSVAMTKRCGRRSLHERPTAQAKVGMARGRSSSLASIRAASTTGYVLLLASRPPPRSRSRRCRRRTWR